MILICCFCCPRQMELSGATVDLDGKRTLSAFQLVYSNVEVPDSPRSRRGFQVLLQTLGDPEFSQVVRDEVESLLSGFHNPAKFPPSSVRRMFCLVDFGRKVMVAEARSNPKPDKFNREGRFHSHALIFNAEEFREVARNYPFAVFDGGFQFQQLPEVDKNNTDWKNGHIPKIDVPVKSCPPRTEIAGSAMIPNTLLLQVAKWLVVEPAERPVLALPYPPEEVERFLHQLLALLPVSQRVLASFDTYWPGRGKYPPQIAGAGTAESLALWSYRQHSRFDLRRQQVQPPITIQENWQTNLVGHWYAHLNIPQEDCEGSWKLLTWLTGPDGHSCPKVTNAVINYVGKLPLDSKYWKKKIEKKCSRSFPGKLGEYEWLKERVCKWIGGWSQVGLAQLEKEITIAEAAGWIEEYLCTLKKVSETTADTAKVVLDWQEQHDETCTENLKYLCYRWLPQSQIELHKKLRDVSTPEDESIREYCKSTLPEQYCKPADAKKLLRAMLGAKPPTGHAQWFSSVFFNEADDASFKFRNRVNFLLAYDSEFELNPLDFYPLVRDCILTKLLPWYARPPRISPVALLASPNVLGHLFYVGYRVDFSGLPDVHRKVFDYLVSKKTVHVQNRFRHFFVASDPGAIDKWHAPPGAAYMNQVNKLASKGKRDLLIEFFKKSSDADFQGLVASELIDNFAASFVWRELEPATDSVFIGLVIRKNMEVDDKSKILLLTTLVESAIDIQKLTAERFESILEMPYRLKGLVRRLFAKVSPSILRRDQ